MKDWRVRESREENLIRYTVAWSPWGMMERWVVSRRIPAEAGIFQLWTMNKRYLELLVTEIAYYGGLRATLREATDLLAPSGKRLRDIMKNKPSWFRYSVLPYHKALRNLLWWYTGRGAKPHYEIEVTEVASEARFRGPPPRYRCGRCKKEAGGHHLWPYVAEPELNRHSL